MRKQRCPICGTMKSIKKFRNNGACTLCERKHGEMEKCEVCRSIVPVSQMTGTLCSTCSKTEEDKERERVEHETQLRIKRAKRKEYRMKRSQEQVLFNYAKHRALKIGREFDIDVSDIVIPEVCPILGIPLFRGEGQPCDNSPSLDRVDNNKGYIKGNVRVISFKANSIKKHLNISDITNLYRYVIGGCRTDG